MARIAGINIPPQQHAEIGLTAILALVAPALARFARLATSRMPRKSRI